ncbi:MAG: DUF4145 domain-containing protein [Kouleothrix sp.]|jgi:hypothetical protein|nr:DUF4145 domain-containing protein [Kouleothrix sp.]
MLNFKRLTTTNWLEADETSKLFGRVSPDGTFVAMTGEDWLEFILTPKLAAIVPSEVHDLFEVARGALAYGYFFYPLYTLATEQLFRVVDAAVTHKSHQCGLSRERTFNNRINALVRHGVIPQSDADKWHAIRQLRNRASHSTSQSIFTPGITMTFLEGIVADINALFSDP